MPDEVLVSASFFRQDTKPCRTAVVGSSCGKLEIAYAAIGTCTVFVDWMANGHQSNSDGGRRKRSPSLADVPPPRVFCTLKEAALFLGLPYDALRKRIQRGTLLGIARTVEGSIWRPSGRQQLLIETAALREQLHPAKRERFDEWQHGRISLAAVARQMKREQRSTA